MFFTLQTLKPWTRRTQGLSNKKIGRSLYIHEAHITRSDLYRHWMSRRHGTPVEGHMPPPSTTETTNGRHAGFLLIGRNVCLFCLEAWDMCCLWPGNLCLSLQTPSLWKRSYDFRKEVWYHVDYKVFLPKSSSWVWCCSQQNPLSFERGHGYLTKQFQYHQALNFVVVTVTRNHFPMFLNMSKINCLGSDTRSLNQPS